MGLKWVVALLLSTLLTLSEAGAQNSQKKGFRSGARPFGNSNPFNSKPSTAQAPQTAQRPSVTLPRRKGTPARGKDVVDPKLDRGGVSIGGSKGGGIRNEAPVLPLRIDTETGAGSNAIVTDFNYQEVNISELAKTMGKLTGKNFIVDKNLKGNVTIISNSPITVGDAWRAFLTALDVNAFTLLPAGKFIRIARQRDARDKQINTYVGSFAPTTDLLITRVFSLKHISAAEVARMLRSFVPANARIVPYAQTNTIIVIDTASNIDKLAKIIGVLDVEGFDAGIEVISVNWASAVELAKLIDSLIPGTTAGTRSGKRSSRSRSSGFSARRTKEGGIINTIIGDERTNSLIVHANAKGVDQVRELVKKLDIKDTAQTGGGKIHVVYLQYADAKKVESTLQSLSNQSGRSSTRSTTRSTRTSTRRTQAKTPNTSASLFEGQIKVAADEATNSLVITASPADFVTVERVISKLDIPRDEVFVEVIIMEVSLGNNLDFSPNILLPGSGVGIAPNPSEIINFITNPLASQGAILNWETSSKKKFPITDASGETKDYEIGNVYVLVKALQTNFKGNVLATPQVLTLDNEEATFSTTEQIPTQTVTNTNQGVSASISYKSVGLTMKVKPQINKVSSFLKLDVDTKLEDISKRALPSALQGQAFPTFERSVKTVITVSDGDTIVIGGLIRDKRNDSIIQVPLLGDIPILGWLFKSTKTEFEKTNLIIFMTPKIIRHHQKIRNILSKALKRRDEFIEKNAGGDDFHRSYRDEIIRELPSVEELEKFSSVSGSVKPSGLVPGQETAREEEIEEYEAEEEDLEGSEDDVEADLFGEEEEE